MTWQRLLFAAIRHDAFVALLTSLGVAVATAVVVGALVLGDSVESSLRALALERIGEVDRVVVAPRLFTPPHALGTPAILLDAAIETDARSCGVDLVALATLRDGAVVSASLASDLALGVGDTLRLRIDLPTPIPRDAAFGEKTETLLRATLPVASIGSEQFTLRLAQQEPRTVYVPLAWLGLRLRAGDKVNAILLTTEDVPRWDAWNRVAPSDLGLQITRRDGTLFIASQRLLFTPSEASLLRKTLAEWDFLEVFVNLAESIRCGERTIPYSTVAALNRLSPLPTTENTTIPVDFGDDAIVLNAWAAEQLAARVGDTITLTVFDPESLDATATRHTFTRRLVAIVPMSGLYAAPEMVPEIEGMTNVTSIADWQPPFPFDIKTIRPDDEAYWDEYRAAPKAFVAQSTARTLWSNRFGETTTFVLKDAPASFTDSEAFASQLFAADRVAFGFETIPLRDHVVAASAGTTPFGVLFFLLSLFVLVAAAMLIVLLTRLLLERRMRETRLLASLGFTPRAVRRRLLAEGVLLASAGTLLGLPLGIAYAALLIRGLSTWWRDAIVVPFVKLHLDPTTLLVGGLLGLALAVVVIVVQTRGASLATASLATPRSVSRSSSHSLARRIVRGLTSPIPIAAMLIGLVMLASSAEGEMSRAAVFFGTGAYTLLVGILLLARWLDNDDRTRTTQPLATRSLARLAVSEARRHPTRTLTCVALIASAAFVVLSMGAFRWSGSDDLTQRDSGSGGLSLIVETRLPIFSDLGDAASRATLGATDAEETAWRESETRAFACRVRDGGDASCQNLYRSAAPRILGLPESFIARGGFRFSSHRAVERSSPWHLLCAPAKKNTDGVWRVPVILDESTAMYALHLSGVGAVFRGQRGDGTSIDYEVVALLSGSLFQGDVLVSEENLLAIFPDVSGTRFFAVETRDVAGTSRTFQRLFRDLGAVDETPRERLTRFFSVQNSYLSIFQSLGGLGLLLGVVGIAVVQFRSVVSRRWELGLMLAMGFHRHRLAWCVVMEVLVLAMVASLIAGVAATFAVWPRLGLGGGGAHATSFALAAVLTLGGTTLVALVSSLAAVSVVWRLPIALAQGPVSLVAILLSVVVATTVAVANAAEVSREAKAVAVTQVEIDRAIERGLAWLASRQSSRGGWDTQQEMYPTAMTGLSGIALLMEGSTAVHGRYAPQIRAAVDFLLDRARPNGLIGDERDDRYTYGHGFSMLFLSQVLGEEDDLQRRDEMLDALARGVEFCGLAQTRAGGWGYVSAKDGRDFDEGSTTITQVQALRGARNAGVSVPKEVIDRAVGYIHRCAISGGSGGIAYNIHGGGGRPPISAAAIACLYSAGEYDDAFVPALLRYCDAHLFSTQDNGHWHYAQYYFAQVKYREGGEAWERYKAKIFPILLQQIQSDGSWSPSSFGTVYTTSIALAILQLDRATLPIYQR